MAEMSEQELTASFFGDEEVSSASPYGAGGKRSGSLYAGRYIHFGVCSCLRLLFRNRSKKA